MLSKGNSRSSLEMVKAVLPSLLFWKEWFKGPESGSPSLEGGPASTPGLITLSITFRVLTAACTFLVHLFTMCVGFSLRGQGSVCLLLCGVPKAYNSVWHGQCSVIIVR